jgi:hypothetical protein
VHKIKKKVGNRWGLSKQPINLMNKSNVAVKIIIGGPTIMVLLNWFSKSHGNINFTYDVIDIDWVDFDSIIPTLTMNYEKEYIYIR